VQEEDEEEVEKQAYCAVLKYLLNVAFAFSQLPLQAISLFHK
jgi:hypothetical protein